MNKNLRILLAFTLFAVCAASSAAWFTYSVARKSLEESARNNLTLARETKKRQIQSLFEQLRKQIIWDASNGLYNPKTSGPQHLGVVKRQILLCSPLFPALPKAAAHAAQETCSKNSVDAENFTLLTDFITTDHGSVAFLFARIGNANSLAPRQILLYEFSANALNNIMIAAESWPHEGFGRSGETYIVGSDLLMRTNSRFAVENLSAFLKHLSTENVPDTVINRIKQSGSTALTFPVNTQAAREALSGKTDTNTLRDYRNILVLSSFTPLQIPDVHWALLSEIDYDEAFSAVTQLRGTLLLYTAILAFAFLLLGSLLARAIATPLDNLARQALEISEGIQRRIGHDLHDDLAQKIVGISLLAKASAKVLKQNDKTSADEFERLASLADEAVQTARKLARGLSPVPLLKHGLADALVVLATETETKHPNIKVEADILQFLPSLTDEESLHLYRIAQEAISNAIQHGNPSHIQLSFLCEHDYCTLVVDNNGAPFMNSQSSDGMGLSIMAMRSRAVGGVLEVHVLPSGWTQVRCQLKCSRRVSK